MSEDEGKRKLYRTIDVTVDTMWCCCQGKQIDSTLVLLGTFMFDTCLMCDYKKSTHLVYQTRKSNWFQCPSVNKQMIDDCVLTENNLVDTSSKFALQVCVRTGGCTMLKVKDDCEANSNIIIFSMNLGSALSLITTVYVHGGVAGAKAKGLLLSRFCQDTPALILASWLQVTSGRDLGDLGDILSASLTLPECHV